MRFTTLVLTLGLLLTLVITSGTARAATIVVDTTADDALTNSNCTLREAITAANTNTAVDACSAGSGTDTITFNIPGAGPHTIQPTSALPPITGPVIIDGYSQPGASPNTNGAGLGLNTVLMIELDGSIAGAGLTGLDITSSGSTVRGLTVNRFFIGIRLLSDGNSIEGNFVGTDVTGTAALGNLENGVNVNGALNIIGGTTSAARNLVSGNVSVGVFIIGAGSTGNLVQGNLIGTDFTGDNPLGNGSSGVFATFGASDNTIGGIVSGTGNTVAFNRTGPFVFTGTGNAILSNSIFSNFLLGIELDGADQGVTPNDSGDADTGANNRQNFPVLTSAIVDGGTTIEGTLNSTASTDFRLEFFSNAACDSSGFGEGESLLGSIDVTTDAGGNVSFSVTFAASVPKGHLITATATDPDGNTSEFSRCAEVTGTGADVSVEKSTTATLAGGIGPDDIRVNPDTNRIYINNIIGGTVSVIDGSTNTIIATVPVGNNPEDVVVNRITNRVYVNNRQSGSVSVIDGATNSVIATIPVGVFPDDVRINLATNRVYVNNRDSDTMSVIDGANNTVIATIPVGDRPNDFQINPVTNKIYVVNEASNNVTVIDGATNGVIATLPVGTGPRNPQVNTVTNRIYVRSTADDAITVIDGASDTVLATVAVGDFPDDVRINRDTNRIYVANRSDNTVSVIDGATNLVVDTIPVELRPDRMRLNPFNNKVYVLNRNSDSVSIIDGATNLVLATPSVGDRPQEVRINPATNRVYVVNRDSNDVSVIDGTSDAVIDTIPVASTQSTWSW